MIVVSFTYDPEDQLLIDAFESLAPNLQLGSYWSDAALDALKSKVKTFYIEIQNARCCYCNRHMGSTNHRLWDLDHIVSRSKHVRFMFAAKNIAASCPDCNQSKSDQETLVNTSRKTYPSNSAAFRIVHPHFDAFEDHIKLVGMVYLPKTVKGKKTIYVCDLMRFAQKFIDWENSASDTSFEKEVDEVFGEQPVVSEGAVDAIILKLQVK